MKMILELILIVKPFTLWFIPKVTTHYINGECFCVFLPSIYTVIYTFLSSVDLSILIL